jgi:glycosyltransferase involved in cell wall biosynthesis
MAEKVQDGYNGFTFRTGDAGHLAERIVQLLDDPTLLNTFKANMRQVQIPSIEQEAAAYETIYNSLGSVKKKRTRRLRRRSGRTLLPR